MSAAATGRRRLPLAGRTILVTRPAERAGALEERLRALGATVLAAPTIEIRPPRSRARLDRAIARAAEGAFAWVTFTSRTTVEMWFDRPGTAGGESRRPRALVAAVGSGTAAALRGHGVEPDLVPRAFTTEALGRAFPSGRGRVLLPRADIAPEGLEDTLRTKGWTPERVEAYRVRAPRSLPAEAREALHGGRIDAVMFTSASTVEGFVRLAAVPTGPKVVCIGPVTARAAREAGLPVDAVARPHSLRGLVDAVVRALAAT